DVHPRILRVEPLFGRGSVGAAIVKEPIPPDCAIRTDDARPQEGEIELDPSEYAVLLLGELPRWIGVIAERRCRCGGIIDKAADEICQPLGSMFRRPLLQ